MRVSPLRKMMLDLRREINDRGIDHIENMLNKSKGLGTTPALVRAALRDNLTLVTHSQDWADRLMELHPGLVAKPFDTVHGAERCLIDNGVNWHLLRRAQVIRKLGETLLNWMETKNIGDV